jgi:hypothetical protein
MGIQPSWGIRLASHAASIINNSNISNSNSNSITITHASGHNDDNDDNTYTCKQNYWGNMHLLTSSLKIRYESDCSTNGYDSNVCK